MKRTSILILIITFIFNCLGQTTAVTPDLQGIAQIRNKGKVLMIRDAYQIPVQDFFAKYHVQFGLTSADDMVLKEEIVKINGNKDYRYQQHFHGIPVEGATLILHENNGKIVSCNGSIVNNFHRPFTPVVDAENAVQTAINNTPAKTYAWEVAVLEQDIKTQHQNEKATYYPTPKLIFFDPDYSYNAQNYRLTYAIDILSVEPFNRQIVYVDATTGAVTKIVKKNQRINVEVQAETRYDGIRTITVDSVAPTQFYLREIGRGAGDGILTRTLNNTGNLFMMDTNEASDIIENDNYFNRDRVANSAHYGAEKTYDYYFQKFNRNSVDNQGMRLTSYVHYGTNIDNAGWAQNAMFYGDGSNGYEFTFLTVCGHEITHGVTENTANLVYEDESGALNESFSDMLGVMIAYYASDTLKWTIGDEIQQTFRDMSNPKAYENPDTYKGTYWVSDGSDNGGVHTNSGVGNYWFYLLCQGGEGINDNGTYYHVEPIGTTMAENIAYTTLTSYLIETSDYHDIYEYSIMAAEELYGNCSQAVQTVSDAWNAVGVGRNFSDTTVFLNSVLSPATDCALGNEETVTIELAYNSCNQILPAGTNILIRTVVDQQTELLDTIVLENDIQPGSSFTVTLHNTVDVSTSGTHNLSIWVKPSFTVNYTDSIMQYQFTNLVYQNTDLQLVKITSPVSSCTLDENTTVSCEIAFNICDSIAAGTSFTVAYLLDNNGDTIRETCRLDQTVTPQDTIQFTFATPADFTLISRHSLKVFVEMDGDMNSSNNQKSSNIYRPRRLNEVNTLTFNESNQSDFYYLEKEANATAKVATLSGYNDGKLLQMSGGEIMNYYDQLEFPETEDELWEANPSLNARAVFCADATDLANFAISFDLKQTSGKDFYEYLLGTTTDEFNLLYTSMMRILVDGEQVSDNYFPHTASSDQFTNHTVDLNDYRGDLHTITIESKCLSDDLLFFQCDHVYVDNISIMTNTGVNDLTPTSTVISLYPNPTNQNCYLQIDNQLITDQLLQYRIYDVCGKKLCEKNISEDVMKIDLSNYRAGIYVLEVIHGNKVLDTKKIIKTAE